MEKKLEEKIYRIAILLEKFFYLPDDLREYFINSVECPYYEDGRCNVIPENCYGIISSEKKKYLISLRKFYSEKYNCENEKNGIRKCYISEIREDGIHFADEIYKKIKKIQKKRKQILEEKIMEEVINHVKKYVER